MTRKSRVALQRLLDLADEIGHLRAAIASDRDKLNRMSLRITALENRERFPVSMVSHASYPEATRRLEERR